MLSLYFFFFFNKTKDISEGIALSCGLLGQNINAYFYSWEFKNVVEANVEVFKKLVIYYESLSHTLEGKTTSALLASIVGDFDVLGNKCIVSVFCASKKASSCKFLDNF